MQNALIQSSITIKPHRKHLKYICILVSHYLILGGRSEGELFVPVLLDLNIKSALLFLPLYFALHLIPICYTVTVLI